MLKMTKNSSNRKYSSRSKTKSERKSNSTSNGNGNSNVDCSRNVVIMVTVMRIHPEVAAQKCRDHVQVIIRHGKYSLNGNREVETD